MTGMGVGRNRRELNGDQQDRRPNHSQNVPVKVMRSYYHTVRAEGNSGLKLR